MRIDISKFAYELIFCKRIDKSMNGNNLKFKKDFYFVNKYGMISDCKLQLFVLNNPTFNLEKVNSIQLIEKKECIISDSFYLAAIVVILTLQLVIINHVGWLTNLFILLLLVFVGFVFKKDKLYVEILMKESKSLIFNVNVGDKGKANLFIRNIKLCKEIYELD